MADRINWWRILPWTGAAALLGAAAVASRTVAGFDWTARDFAAMGILLALACLGLDVALRLAGGTLHRAALALMLVTGLAMVWINLAVGIIGSEDDPANLVFFAILAGGATGAALTRLSAAGMTLVAGQMAGATALVALALATGGHPREGLLVLGFAGLWAAAAALLGKAAGLARQWTT